MVAFQTIQNRMKIRFVVQLGETHPQQNIFTQPKELLRVSLLHLKNIHTSRLQIKDSFLIFINIDALNWSLPY
jgi:hypothetical protein